MPGVYGGDDVSAIVIDPGSSLLRAGWAGEDTPRVVVPSSYGWIHDDSATASTSNSTAAPEASSERNEDVVMDTTEDGAPAVAATTEAEDSRSRVAKYLAKKEGSNAGKIKKRFFGDSGVNQWRKGLEISPTVEDGVGE